MKLNELKNMVQKTEGAGPMPALFLGHGSPLNAIRHNDFTDGWHSEAEMMQKPEAILCISAHWETQGTMVTSMTWPRTIHDFGGFPQDLYDVRYPAPGSPGLARKLQESITNNAVGQDEKWGLDHGAWSVLKHMYPDASVPVVQMSLDYHKSPRQHYDLAMEFAPLRKKGILIVGSGNLVHNLRTIDWSGSNAGFGWALEAQDLLKNLISAGEHHQLINYTRLGREVGMAVPTPEHFLPLLYILALKSEGETAVFFNDRIVMGSVSMTSVRIA